MSEWVLIICVYASTLSPSDSLALATVYKFKTERDCMVAGIKSQAFETLKKGSRFICVKTGNDSDKVKDE
jgi:hypothetical protein